MLTALSITGLVILFQNRPQAPPVPDLTFDLGQNQNTAVTSTPIQSGPTTIPTLSPTNPNGQTLAQVAASPQATATDSSIRSNEPVKPKVVKAALIKTNKGDIAITFFPDEAPKTIQNFLTKASVGFYKNLTFHRVEDWVIQGGDPKGNGTGGGQIATELSDQPFVAGSVGVARGQDVKISNDAQFFITKKDASWLDGQYTIFGQVVSGMDVVNKITVGDKILDILLVEEE